MTAAKFQNYARHAARHHRRAGLDRAAERELMAEARPAYACPLRADCDRWLCTCERVNGPQPPANSVRQYCRIAGGELDWPRMTANQAGPSLARRGE